MKEEVCTSTTTVDLSSSADSNPPSSIQDVPRSLKNFKKSSPPSRILQFQEHTGWVDFPKHVFDELSSTFLAGKPVCQLSVDGSLCVFDFVRMIKIDVSTKVVVRIGWIDENGRCFFPTASPNNQSLNVVEKLFRNGMRRVNVAVTKVRKCLHTSSCDWRLRVFRMMMEKTKESRGGTANVKFGWYGASAEDVANVVKHGFGKANNGAHGVGVHLSPADNPYASSLLSREDGNGEKHMVLCRVIMGNSEKVEAGSVQSHPSNDRFDSGIDDLANPKWYVVWSTKMNTHIIPEYVVSFKAASVSRPQPLVTKRASTMNLSKRTEFHNLLSELRRYLPQERMQALIKLYKQHKAGVMNRDTFLRHFRSVASDKVVAMVMRKIQGHT